MQNYPDINNSEELVDAIYNLEVLGEFSRTYTFDPRTNNIEVERYVEKVRDYYSKFQIQQAVKLLDQNHVIAGLDGFPIAQSLEKITYKYADGTERDYILSATRLPKYQD